MGALGHYLEAEGVATVGISLVREHTEHIRPPRTLWVPFDFGRPLGVPGDTDFQRAVVRAALDLLRRPEGIVLEEYLVAAPAGDDAEEAWACPVALPAPEPGASEPERLIRALLDKAARLRPWYEESRRRRGRTTVGVSGLPPEDIDAALETLACFAAGEPASPPPGAAHDLPRLFRFLADDAKSYYQEAVAAQPGSGAPTAQQLARWLYTETTLGDVLFRVRARLAASEDPDSAARKAASSPASSSTSGASRRGRPRRSASPDSALRGDPPHPGRPGRPDIDAAAARLAAPRGFTQEIARLV